MVSNDISNGLCVRSGARTTAVNVVGDLGQLVRHSVGDVRPGGGAGVGPDDDTAVKLASHDRRAGAVRRVHPTHAWVHYCGHHVLI